MGNILGVYCITNNINGKVYIGQSIDVYKRWKDHIRKSNGSMVHRAITKYGYQNFTFSILRTVSSDKPINRILLDCYERFFIRQYNSTNKLKGYNITSGGGSNYTISKEAREHKRQANRKRKHPELWKPVQCIETGVIYESAFSAGKDVNTNRSNITQVCKGTAKTAGGYHWRYSSIEELERYNVRNAMPNTRIIMETVN